MVEPGIEEALPVIRGHLTQRCHYVRQLERQLAPIAIAHPEEQLGEIVDALFAAGALADQLVGLKPDQRPFGVIVLAARQRGVGLGLAPGEHRIAAGVLDRAPLPPGQHRIIAGVIGELPQHHVLALQARARGDHQSPELVLPFIGPQQVALHRLAIIGGPQPRRAAELARPRMAVFVRQQPAIELVLVPRRETVGLKLVLA